MERIIDITGGGGGNSTLIVGNEKTAIIDCGMAFYGEKLVENAENNLKGRKLDYIFLTHSHYDHIGGLPYLREKYPSCVVLAHEHAKDILSKDSAYKLICDLTKNASNIFVDGNKNRTFPKESFAVDEITKEGDTYDLGKVSVKVFETPGHTKCSISFFIPELSTLLTSETTGVASKNSFVFPSYIISSEKALEAARKLSALHAKHVLPPHSEMLDDYKSEHFFKNSIFSINLTRRMILGLYKMNFCVEDILREYESVFADKTQCENQPRWAFRINTEAQIKTVIKEYNEGIIDLEEERLF